VAVNVRPLNDNACEIQRLLIGAGFGDGRWDWLDASPHGFGLIIAENI
jgi:hypothetical protein